MKQKYNNHHKNYNKSHNECILFKPNISQSNNDNSNAQIISTHIKSYKWFIITVIITLYKNKYTCSIVHHVDNTCDFITQHSIGACYLRCQYLAEMGRRLGVDKAGGVHLNLVHVHQIHSNLHIQQCQRCCHNTYGWRSMVSFWLFICGWQCTAMLGSIG